MLRHMNTRLLCLDNREHGVQDVLDLQPLARTVSLACGCRRLIATPQTDAEKLSLAAYLAEEQQRELERFQREQELENEVAA
jgi:hypothetical protein